MPAFLDNLNAMNTGVTRFATGVTQSVNELKKMGSTLDQIVKSGEVAGESPSVLVTGLRLVNKAIQAGSDSLEAQNAALADQLEQLKKRRQQSQTLPGTEASTLDYLNKQIASLGIQQQKNAMILQIREAIGTRAIYWGAVLYKLYADTAKSLKEMNEQLQAAAMSDADRLKTNVAMFSVSRNLGTSLTTNAEVAKEMANFGFEFRDGMEETLETVVMMKEGLGVSADSAAELAAIVTNQLKVGFRDVADSIANTARDTGLSAQLAVKFAQQISRAAAVFREGITAQIPSVIGYVTRLEGLLQEVGGIAGGVTDLITRLTTVEGMVGAALLGVQTPEFLATEEGAKNVMEGFADYAKHFLGDAAGWDRTLRIEMLAQMFGTTAQQVAAMVRAVELENKRMASLTGLRRVYEEQMAATLQGFTRLKNSLVALLKEGLAPAVAVIGTLVNWMAILVGLFQKHAKWFPVAIIALTSLGATVWIAIKAISVLWKACAFLATTAQVAARAVTQQAVANLATGGGGGGAGPYGWVRGAAGRARGLGARGVWVVVKNNFKSLGTALLRFFPKLISLLPMSLGAALAAGPVVAGIGIAIAGAIGVGLGFLLRKLVPAVDQMTQWLMGNKEMYKKTATFTLTTEQWFQRYIQRQAGKGPLDMGAISGVLRKRLEAEGTTGTLLETKMANMLRWAGQQAGQMRYGVWMQGHSLVPHDKEKEEMIRKNQEKIEKETEKQTDIATKSLALQRETDRKREEAEAAIAREKKLNMYRAFGATPTYSIPGLGI